MKEIYMKLAIKEAQKAYKKGEVPIGCIIVKNNKIIAKSHNMKERIKSSLAHAEIICIKKANKKLKNWRLSECELYVTMEPCPMCASAIKQSRIKKVYCGISNKNNKQSELIFKTTDINGTVELEKGILEKECKEILQRFFINQRKND